MESSITKIVMLAASVAAVALVVALMWALLTENTPDPDAEVESYFNKSHAQSAVMCKLAKGTWDASKETCK